MLKKKNLLILPLLFAAQLFLSSIAHADTFIPKVVTIENGQRAASISIINQSDYAKSYDFEWERRVQLPDSTRDILEDGETLEGYRPADPYLTFSPRRVIVQPGESQKVRILARRSADMAPGEYHSHFVIKPDRLNKTEAAEAPQGGMSGIVELKTHFSMPVFLRNGKTTLDFEYQNIRMSQTDGLDIINTDIVNNSTRSVYTIHRLACTQNGETKEYPLNKVRLYVEAREVARKIKFLKKGSPKLAECDSADLNVYAAHDFEYKLNKPFKTYKLK